jgi:hypothetical protein
MSLWSRIRDAVSRKAPPTAATPPPAEGSRHDRREAGRERHHRTGEPAWEASDRIDTPGGSSPNPDAAPEILGGN